MTIRTCASGMLALGSVMVIAFLNLTTEPCCDAFHIPQQGLYHHRRKNHWLHVLRNEANPRPGDDPKFETGTAKPRLGRKDGVYIRPSGAIERGSGFFVPGLEGPRVKAVTGTVLLAATALNHALSKSLGSDPNNDAIISNNTTFLEGLAAVYSILLLIQAVIEYRIGTRRSAATTAAASQSLGLLVAAAEGGGGGGGRSMVYSQQWFIPINDGEWKDRVEWVARTYLSLTPATHMTLLGPGSIVYWLGEFPAPTTTNRNLNGTDEEEAIAKGCKAALETCFQSKSGRVSLPSSHPAVQYLQPSPPPKPLGSTPQQQRCFVLQKVDETSQLCWMMMSNQLLESFTKRDLQWLGQVALYLQQSMPPN